MHKTNFAVGVLFIVFSLVYYFVFIPTQISSSVSHSEYSGAIFRADYFPRITIILFASVSFLLMMNAFREKGQIEWMPGSSGRTFYQAIVVFLIGGIYVYALEWAGFMMSSPFFLAALVIFFGTRDWRYVVPVALLGTILVNYFFCFSFKVILPEGEILSSEVTYYFCPSF